MPHSTPAQELRLIESIVAGHPKGLAGELVGVEVKAAATVKESDLRSLKQFAGRAGEQFRLGVLLYDGTEIVSLGDRL